MSSPQTPKSTVFISASGDVQFYSRQIALKLNERGALTFIDEMAITASHGTDEVSRFLDTVSWVLAAIQVADEMHVLMTRVKIPAALFPQSGGRKTRGLLERYSFWLTLGATIAEGIPIRADEILIAMAQAPESMDGTSQ